MNINPQTNTLHTTIPGKDAFSSKGLGDNITLVEKVQGKAAEIWDVINEAYSKTTNPEGARLLAIAKTELEGAVMWFTKGLSRQGV